MSDKVQDKAQVKYHERNAKVDALIDAALDKIPGALDSGNLLLAQSYAHLAESLMRCRSVPVHGMYED